MLFIHFQADKTGLFSFKSPKVMIILFLDIFNCKSLIDKNMYIDFQGYIHDKYKLPGVHADMHVKIHVLREGICCINAIF